MDAKSKQIYDYLTTGKTNEVQETGSNHVDQTYTKETQSNGKT